MKKLMTIIAVIAVVALGATPAVFAATNSAGPYTVSASVDGTLSMSVVLKKNDWNGTTITTMDFGKLIDIGTGTLRSSSTSTTATGAVCAMITANSHGLPYSITTTGSALSNGTTTLPAGACGCVPTYIAADNGGAAKPTGATLGAAGPWVGTTRAIYTSETGTAKMVALRAYYSITDDPAGGSSGGTTGNVPLSQPGGTYTNTVTITVTA